MGVGVRLASGTSYSVTNSSAGSKDRGTLFPGTKSVAAYPDPTTKKFVLVHCEVDERLGTPSDVSPTYSVGNDVDLSCISTELFWTAF